MEVLRRMKKNGYAIVTGGNRGIGKACAIQLAEEGYDVFYNFTSDRGEPYADETLKELQEKGVEAAYVRADVSDWEGCKKVVDSAIEAFGTNITVLVNNAGICSGKPLYELEPEQIDRMIRTNLLSQLYCCKLVLPHMMEQKKGWIINMASNAGIMGVEKFVDYSASKGGTIALTKALAKEVAEYDIKVNAIAPGCFKSHMLTDTGEENMERRRLQTPLKKLGEMTDMALLVHYLVNTEFLTGQIISPNGGWTI